MRLLVVYDISNNAVREEFAKRLQGIGLTRIQRSCFVGRGDVNKVKQVLRLAEKLLDARRDVVHTILLDEYSFKNIRCFGTPFTSLDVGEDYVLT
jgi:CRISPR-associated protein Cas2